MRVSANTIIGMTSRRKTVPGSVCLWKPTFAAYLAKKKAEGKRYKVALSHAAKKLVRLIYAMEKSRQPYHSAA